MVRCENCQWYEEVLRPAIGMDNRGGKCHRFPPQFINRGYTITGDIGLGSVGPEDASPGSWAFSDVAATDWCGEFAPLEV